MADSPLPLASNFIAACWNVDVQNPNPRSAYESIKTAEWDILSVIEGTPELIRLLWHGPWDAISGNESFRLMPDGSVLPTKNMILVRNPGKILAYKSVPLEEIKPLKFRTRVFIWLLKTARQYGGASKDHQILWADVLIGRETVRVFSAHLKWTHASQRDSDWEIIHRELSNEYPSVVCADTNCFGKAIGAVLNWLLGGEMRESFPFNAEYKRREKSWHEWGLTDAFLGEITQVSKLGGKQSIDRILPKGLYVLRQPYVKKPNPKTKKFDGSDHAFVSLKLAFKK